MKHGKRPTVRQKKLLAQKRLNPDNWLIVKDTPTEMHIVYRYTETGLRVIRKEAEEG